MSRAFAILFSLAVAVPAAAADITGKVTGNGGGSFIVYVEKGPEGAADRAEIRREVTQRNSQFDPVSTWLRAGESVDFVNRDNIYHNVFSPTAGTQFDLGLYRGGLKKTVQMQKAGEVDVYCNIHPDMKTRVLVLPPGTRATDVGTDSTYSLSNLPAGTYTLVAWSAFHEPARMQVEVKEGRAATANFALKTRGAAGQHLNKNGEQYGRYK